MRILLGMAVPVRGFFRQSRAAVGAASVLLASMSFMGVAMLSDYAWLDQQRGVLQGAVDMATLAAMRHMVTLDPALSDADMVTELEPVVKRYILANVGSQATVNRSLKVTVVPDRTNRVVMVNASANMGGALFGKYMWGELVGEVGVRIDSISIVRPVDIVLALDVSGSMGHRLPPPDGRKRIAVVRDAATTLVRALFSQQSEDGHVSVGLVPFNTTVNVGATRTNWVSDLGHGHKVIPDEWGSWLGCIEHRISDDDLDLSLVPPETEQFTSWFSPDTRNYRPDLRAQVVAKLGRYPSGENDWSPLQIAARAQRQGWFIKWSGPHYGCPRNQILPLTTDVNAISQVIAGLEPTEGGGTMTHVGMVWGRRVLASPWREVWGLPEVPGLERRKVLVILTDGANFIEDRSYSYPGRMSQPELKDMRLPFYGQYGGYGTLGTDTPEEGRRIGHRLEGVTSRAAARTILNDTFRDSCDLAKDEGITVFTVSAVPKNSGDYRAVGKLLQDCATTKDHAYVQNNAPNRLEAAFREIGARLIDVRLVGRR